MNRMPRSSFKEFVANLVMDEPLERPSSQHMFMCGIVEAFLYSACQIADFSAISRTRFSP